MTRLVTLEALVLGRFPYREKDFVVHFLTGPWGLVSSVIRGGQAQGKASSFPFETGDWLEASFLEEERGEFHPFKEARKIGGWQLERGGYGSYLYLSLLLEIIKKSARPHLEASELMEFLRTGLGLEKTGQNPLGFLLKGLLAVLEFGGVGLDLTACRRCGRAVYQLREGEGVFRKAEYHLSSEGLLCSDCQPPGQEPTTPAQLKALWLVSQRWDLQAANPPIPEDILQAWLPNLIRLLPGQPAANLRALPLLEVHLGLKLG